MLLEHNFKCKKPTLKPLNVTFAVPDPEVVSYCPHMHYLPIFHTMTVSNVRLSRIVTEFCSQYRRGNNNGLFILFRPIF